MTEPPFRRIAVYGMGLIGGSIALAARRRWPEIHVTAVDRPHVVDAALRTRVADAGGSGLEAAAGADLLVLAAPVLENVRVLGELPAALAGSLLVTDVGSTKRAIGDAAAEALPARLPFVGGHPLAGAATSGVQAARPDLFEDRPWVLTGVPRVTPAIAEALTAFVRGLRAVPQEMDAADHDRLVAYLSHLPQLAVSALMEVVGRRAGAGGLAYAGRGLRDTTRLASSPAATWRDIVATNDDNIAAALDDLIAALQELRADGTADGRPALDRIFTSAARWKGVLEHS